MPLLRTRRRAARVGTLTLRRGGLLARLALIERPMRKADAYAHLEHELGSPPPASLNTLGTNELEHLATSIRTARHRQAAEIAAAAERGLSYVPRLLRGPLRKALG